MNPPPKASIEKSTDSLRTTPFERPRPKRRLMPSVETVAGGASMADPSRQKPATMSRPMSA